MSNPHLLLRLGRLSLLFALVWAGAFFFTALAQAGQPAPDRGFVPPRPTPHEKDNHTAAPKVLFISTSVLAGQGSILPSGVQVVNSGDSITFSIVPSTGYHIQNVWVDSVAQGAVITYVFLNVTTSHSLEAAFAPITYTITPTVVGGDGFIVPSTPQSMAMGSAITFFILPNSHSHILAVGVDGVMQGGVSSVVFTNVLADHALTAAFALDTYLITPTASAGGTLTPSTPQAVSYREGLTFSIVPEANKVITDVVVDGVSQGALTTYTFNNVEAAHTIAAVFDDDSYLLTVWPATNGSIVPGTHYAPRGSSITFTLTTDFGYRIANVWADAIARGPMSTFVFTNVTAPHEISAAFALNTYNITSTVVGTGGSIYPNGVQTYSHGGAQEYQVVANANYYIGEVWVDSVAQAVPNNSTLFNYPFNALTTNHTLTATFAPITYSIFSAVSPVGWGTITPSGAQIVPRGGSTTFSINPSPCYTLRNVYVDGFPIPPTFIYTFTNVIDNHVITATFDRRAFSIFPLVLRSGGTITPSVPITAYYGYTYPFTVTPDIGYDIAHLTVTTGSVIPPVPSIPYIHTFTNVCDNQTIVADFVTRTFNITATASSGGAIAPAGVSTVTYGASKTFTITAIPYHHIENLWIDGGAQPFNQINTFYAFTNVVAHHTISATFAPDPASLYVNVVNSDTVVHGAVTLPGGSTCTASCSLIYYGSPPVTLTAAISGGKFVHWGGAYTGTQNPFTLQMVTTRTITAYFSLYRLYLPFMRKTPRCLYDTSETEPNNFITETLSYGTLCSGLTYTPLPNDYVDWFPFDLPTASVGPVFITMTNNTAFGVQLQLRDGLNNLLAYATTGPVFQINCPTYVAPTCTPGTPFPPGRYYIVVYATNNYNNTPYNLTVTYPGPTAP